MNGIVSSSVNELDSDRARLLAISFEHSHEAKMICDSENRILEVNGAFEAMTGYKAIEVVGKNPRILSSGQMSKEFYDGMWGDLASFSVWKGELIERRKDGSTYPKFLTIAAVRDEQGKITNYLASFIDITSMKEASARLEHLAHKDTLTGLLNRFSFDAILTQNVALARRKKQTLGFVYIDLDGFKKINDSLGHAIGDELLRVMAARFQSSVRESDAVARLGGDEFGIMLAPNALDRVGATIVAERLLQVASQPVEIDGYELHLSASIGISFFPDDGDSPARLMQHADTAMYEAKSHGKNSYHFFSENLYQRAAERLEIENIMRRLLSGNPSDGFYVLYQPQFSLPDRKLIGVEALLRMRHPAQDAPVSPAVFIPIAEDTGLINEIGEWVIDDACRQIREWIDAGVTPVPVSINVSSRQFKSPNLVTHLLDCTTRHRVCPSLITLEITESVAMEQPDRVIEVMRTLKTFGIGLSIDDFGTGYSSLSYLPKLPLDTLKIDRSFVMNIERDEGAASISAATIALAHKLGLTVVAEGVETEEQAGFLRDQNCDAVQGFLLGRPSKPADISALLEVTEQAEAIPVA